MKHSSPDVARKKGDFLQECLSKQNDVKQKKGTGEDKKPEVLEIAEDWPEEQKQREWHKQEKN